MPGTFPPPAMQYIHINKAPSKPKEKAAKKMHNINRPKNEKIKRMGSNFYLPVTASEGGEGSDGIPRPPYCWDK